MLRVVRIRGRRSGDVHQVPLAVITIGGRQFLASPMASRPWARNLVGDPFCEVVSAYGMEQVVARPADPDQAIAVLRLYLGLLGWAAEQFPFNARDSDVTITERLPEVAVFRLDPRPRH